MTAYGTELPIPNVRSSVANGGKADKKLNASSSHFDPDRSSALVGQCTAAPRFRTIQVYPKDLRVASGAS
jgi:hypothetical protein